MSRKTIAVAIPIYNEEKIIPELAKRLQASSSVESSYDFLFLFVDDGSSDNSFPMLVQLSQSDPRFQVIRFSRNFGHQAALTAALNNAEGDIVVLMDGDLQDPPEVISEYLRQYEQGFDVVYGIRIKRKEPLWLRVCYRVYYRLLASMSSYEIPLDSGDFSLLSRRVVDLLKQMPECHRYLRGLRAWTGFKQIGVTVERSERYAGVRKYTLSKLFALAADGIFSFSIVPLRAAVGFGLLAIALSSAYALYAVAVRIYGPNAPSGFSALLVTIVFLSGVQLLFFGIIGEYIGRIYEECKKRPQYIIDTVIKRS